MQTSPTPSQPITLVISEMVEPSLIAEYEDWTRGINHATQKFGGCMGVEVIRPRDHQHPEYVVIVKFANYEYYKAWLDSDEYAQWMRRASQFIAKRSHQHQPNGLELWFTLPKSSMIGAKPPAYYKQVIVGILSVYPLIILANLVIAPFLQGLPDLLALLISVTFVSALITYPVMPILTKILGFWLYPHPRPKRPKNKRH
jgi:hypothetical protein